MGKDIKPSVNVTAVNDTAFACLIRNVLVWELQAVAEKYIDRGGANGPIYVG